jgi:hypothetical protein
MLAKNDLQKNNEKEAMADKTKVMVKKLKGMTPEEIEADGLRAFQMNILQLPRWHQEADVILIEKLEKIIDLVKNKEDGSNDDMELQLNIKLLELEKLGDKKGVEFIKKWQVIRSNVSNHDKAEEVSALQQIVNKIREHKNNEDIRESSTKVASCNSMIVALGGIAAMLATYVKRNGVAAIQNEFAAITTQETVTNDMKAENDYNQFKVHMADAGLPTNEWISDIGKVDEANPEHRDKEIIATKKKWNKAITSLKKLTQSPATLNALEKFKEICFLGKEGEEDPQWVNLGGFTRGHDASLIKDIGDLEAKYMGQKLTELEKSHERMDRIKRGDNEHYPSKIWRHYSSDAKVCMTKYLTDFGDWKKVEIISGEERTDRWLIVKEEEKKEAYIVPKEALETKEATLYVTHDVKWGKIMPRKTPLPEDFVNIMTNDMAMQLYKLDDITQYRKRQDGRFDATVRSWVDVLMGDITVQEGGKAGQEMFYEFVIDVDFGNGRIEEVKILSKPISYENVFGTHKTRRGSNRAS